MSHDVRYRALPWLAVFAASLIGSGCETYAPLPLDQHVQPRSRVDQLEHGATRGDTLSIDDVILLAVDNNPDLVSARAQRGLSRAQVLEAGIAPNPSLSANYGFLLGGPGTIAAVAGGLSEDIRGLLTLSYRKAAAGQAALDADAALLWQEWQTIAKARQLGVDIIEGAKRRDLVAATARRLGDLKDRNDTALRRGDTTLTALLPDVSAEAAVLQQLADLDRRQATDRRDLDALLGLDVTASVHLTSTIELPAVDSDGIRRSLDTLPERRPDLVALQYGYQSQETRLRVAILSQFPLLSLGVSGGHDNSDVRFLGPQLTVDLPVFNWNQGNIAIERATRQQLHEEFSARLIAARTEVLGLLEDQRLQERQLDAMRARQPELDRTAALSAAAYQARDLDERSYLDALGVRDTNRLEMLAVEQSLLQQQIVIAALAGIGMPPVTLPRPGTT